MKKIELNKNILLLVVALAVVVGVGGRIGWGYLSLGNTVTAESLSASASDKKQTLIDGLRNGQVLYYEAADFKKGRLGLSEVPDHVIVEAWLAQGENGNASSAVSLTSNAAGEFLIHTYFEDGQIISRYLASGEELIVPLIHRKTMEDWVHEVWDRTQSGFGSHSKKRGAGTLNGKESVIFELRSNPKANPGGPVPYGLLKRLELVKDDPLLAKKSLYEVDESGVETLVRDFTIIEYRLLPPGSAMPPAP